MNEPGEGRTQASIDVDGSCTWSGFGGRVQWASLADVAERYWTDSGFRRAKASYGPGQEFVASLTRSGEQGAIDAIQALVDAAVSEDELNFVGAGPLEDLVSHNGHGLAFVDEVERRARQQPPFRVALAGVWLGLDVPESVRSRLTTLGAGQSEQPPRHDRRT